MPVLVESTQRACARHGLEQTYFVTDKNQRTGHGGAQIADDLLHE
jgi:hypothetical protein